MCRFLGYVGPTVALSSLLYDPPWSLRRQSWEPRYQDVGRVNADGWGVGWYDPDVGPEPARYRTATPIWADQRFEGIARHVRAGHVVAALRNATVGLPVEETGASPFTAGRYLFTHNGWVEGWNQGVGVKLRRSLSEERETSIAGRSDSEVVFALVLDRLDAGQPPAEAMPSVVDELQALAGGRYNLLLSDGETITATRDGASLFVRRGSGDGSAAISSGGARGGAVASEPWDDGPAWDEVPDRSVVTLTADDLTIEPL